MSRTAMIRLAPALLAAALALPAPGCSGGSAEGEEDISSLEFTPTHNPNPNSAIKDIDISNEYENMDRLQSGKESGR